MARLAAAAGGRVAARKGFTEGLVELTPPGRLLEGGNRPGVLQGIVVNALLRLKGRTPSACEKLELYLK